MNSVIVVGGGVIGLFTAYQFLEHGIQVTLIDRQAFGRESSWAGGGIVSPLFPWRYPQAITDLSSISQKLYPAILQKMQQDTGLDPELISSGMLVLGDYLDEQPQHWAESNGINMQRVDQSLIHLLAPEISEDYHRGYWFPEVQQVRNPRLVQVTVAYLQKTDAQLIENQPVTGLLTTQGRVNGVSTVSGDFHADAVVIAGGAWTSGIIQQHPMTTQIRPIKGQMLLLKGKPGVVKRITLSEDRYIIPRKDGRVLVGSTTEDVGYDKSVCDNTRQILLDYALQTIPALKDFEIEHHWSGLRPCSSNEIPVIAEHPSLDGLFINSGHYRNGLVMAPASAQLLTEIMLGKTTCTATEPYASCDALHNTNQGIDRSSLQTSTPSLP